MVPRTICKLVSPPSSPVWRTVGCTLAGRCSYQRQSPWRSVSPTRARACKEPLNSEALFLGFSGQCFASAVDLAVISSPSDFVVAFWALLGLGADFGGLLIHLRFVLDGLGAHLGSLGGVLGFQFGRDSFLEARG